MRLVSREVLADLSSDVRCSIPSIVVVYVDINRDFRTQTERRMVEICEGNKTKREMLDESIEQYKEMFMKTKIEFAKLINVCEQTCCGAVLSVLTLNLVCWRSLTRERPR